MDISIILYNLAGPFLIWPVEHFLPYPFVIEEVFKLLVVKFGAKGIKNYLLGGVAFAVTETILYTINVNILESISFMALRLVTTSILHSTTYWVIYTAQAKNKNLIWIGFAIAVLVHYLYNSYVPSY